MPKPTLDNSKFFKNLLKKYKDKFTSPIQTCQLTDLEAMWTNDNKASSYPTSDQQVNVVLWDGYENSTPIDITTPVNNNQLVYFPAVYGDAIVVKIGDSYHEIKFPYDDGPIQLGGNSQTGTGTWANVALGQTVSLNNRYTNGRGFRQNPFTVKAYGGALVDFGGGITAEITAPSSAISVNEGGQVPFTLKVTGVTGNHSSYFKIKWEGTVSFSNADFVSGAQPTNFGTYWNIPTNTNGVVTKTAQLREDYSVTDPAEGSEWFKMKLVDPNDDSIVLAESPIVTVNDTSQATYSISATPTTITEGNPITYTINTTGIPNGTNLYWKGTGTAATNSDFGHNDWNAEWSGQIQNNTVSFTLTPIQDFTLDNGENFTVDLWTGPYSWDVKVATSNTVTINNQAWTATITPDKTTVQESTSSVTNAVTFNFATSGIPDGTVLRCTTKAVGTSTFKSIDVYKTGGNWDVQGSNYNISSFYNDVTINNSAASLSLSIVRDGKTEGNEQFYLEAKATSSGNTGIVVAVSPTITITDHSVVGMSKTGKTFGPVRVNRDGGNAAAVSDWYTICGLDKLPNNSKIALYIDTSGSMTMNTVQASFDLMMQKLNARNMDVITVTNPNEDWVTPFQQILN